MALKVDFHPSLQKPPQETATTLLVGLLQAVTIVKLPLADTSQATLLFMLTGKRLGQTSILATGMITLSLLTKATASPPLKTLLSVPISSLVGQPKKVILQNLLPPSLHPTTTMQYGQRITMKVALTTQAT